MKLQDVIAGKYYYAKYKDSGDYVIVRPIHNGRFSDSPGIRFPQKYYLSQNGWATKEDIREATSEEIQILQLEMDPSLLEPKIINYEIF